MQNNPSASLDMGSPLIKLVGAARRLIRQSFWVRYAPLGLTPQQGWILRELRARGPQSLHCLAQGVFMDDPTACRVVKPLHEKGLVASIPDPSHGRRIVISLSETGALVAPELDAIADQLGRDLAAGLSAAELDCLRGGLLKIIANLSSPVPPA
jgi:DNA-binding MarR family transcriptional regulator